MLLRQSSNPRVAKKKILSGYTTSATAVPFSRSRFQVISVLIERGILDGAPAVKHSCAQSLTGAPTVPYSRSRFQVTSMLIHNFKTFSSKINSYSLSEESLTHQMVNFQQILTFYDHAEEKNNHSFGG